MTRARGPALVFAVLALAPLFFSPGGDVLNNMVLAATYVVMALGLNIIVGFAGLLDLGYVAFYAIGAYTAAYFGSGFWANADVAVLAGNSVAKAPGIHLNFVLILVLAVVATVIAGALIGAPDAALARRLHRGRHAGLRRDHRPGRVQRPPDRALRRDADLGRTTSARSTASSCR